MPTNDEESSSLDDAALNNLPKTLESLELLCEQKLQVIHLQPLVRLKRFKNCFGNVNQQGHLPVSLEDVHLEELGVAGQSASHWAALIAQSKIKKLKISSAIGAFPLDIITENLPQTLEMFNAVGVAVVHTSDNLLKRPNPTRLKYIGIPELSNDEARKHYINELLVSSESVTEVEMTYQTLLSQTPQEWLQILPPTVEKIRTKSDDGMGTYFLSQYNRFLDGFRQLVKQSNRNIELIHEVKHTTFGGLFYS